MEDSKTTLDCLPPEIIVKIAGYLNDANELLAFNHVSGYVFRALSQAESIWKQQLESFPCW